MQYGQGKDINANLRKTRGYGSGWESVVQFVDGTVTAGLGAVKRDGNKAVQGLSLMKSSILNFADKVLVNKLMTSGSLDLSTPSFTLTGLSMTPSLSTNSQPSAGSLASTSMDKRGGYNPQSETYRSGNGDIVTDGNKTFEQLAMAALDKNNTFTASKGKKLNYLSFFN